MKPARIYSVISGYTPIKLLQPIIDKEERPCLCYEDMDHCRQFESDGAIVLSATPIIIRFDTDIMIRAKRACGLVLYFEASLYNLDRIEGEQFWWGIHRVVSKHCESLYRYEPPLTRTAPTKKPKPDRARASGSWRARR